MASLVCLRTMNLMKFQGPLFRAVVCGYATGPGAGGGGVKPPGPPPPPKPKAQPAAASPTPVDNSKYSCPDYYNFNEYSFIDLDVDMASQRIKQPSKFIKIGV